jgi:hypothetical protein
MGLEGIVSKGRDFPYHSGRTKCWIKVKNPASPAMLRMQDGTWGQRVEPASDRKETRVVTTHASLGLHIQSLYCVTVRHRG